MEVNGVTLLLIEDDHVDAEAILRAFRREKIANPFVVVRDGVDALAALRGEPGAPPVPRPLIVLLDINMPRMNGLEFLRALRADPALRRTIVFVLTTSDREEDKMEAYNGNVAGYIVKNRAGEDFLRVVQLLRAFWRIVEFPPDEAPPPAVPT
ncbi:MAG TPA: response regulator [Rubricoccaceae bacterium]|jgi:CheY-like chemotaxis protein